MYSSVHLHIMTILLSDGNKILADNHFGHDRPFENNAEHTNVFTE